MTPFNLLLIQNPVKSRMKSKYISFYCHCKSTDFCNINNTYWPLLSSNQNPIFLIDHSNSQSSVLQMRISQQPSAWFCILWQPAMTFWTFWTWTWQSRCHLRPCITTGAVRTLLSRRRSCWWAAAHQARQLSLQWGRRGCLQQADKGRAPLSPASPARAEQGQGLQLMCLWRRMLLPAGWVPQIRACCSSISEPGCAGSSQAQESAVLNLKCLRCSLHLPAGCFVIYCKFNKPCPLLIRSFSAQLSPPISPVLPQAFLVSRLFWWLQSLCLCSLPLAAVRVNSSSLTECKITTQQWECWPCSGV